MEVSDGMVILLGIGIVFFGLICIIVLCTIMGAVVRKFAKKPEASAPAAPAPVVEQAVIPNRREMVAAVSAAIAEELGVEVSGIKILSIKKI